MIHNGIEYGLMQSYAEGFDILRNANSKELAAELPLRSEYPRYRRGVAARQRGRLVAAGPDRHGAGRDPELSSFTGTVQDSGEGRWTIVAALEEAVPADVLSASLFTRFRSRQDHTFAEKVLSAMRNKFGGHVERPGRRIRHVRMKRL